MTMTLSFTRTALLLGAMACLPLSLQAHRMWMLPSSTILSGADPWVTVDAAVSNELFYFDHVPARLQNLTIIAPDGSKAQPENAATGKYRSTFDVHLTQKGTYKLAVVNNSAFANYEENGEKKMWRGPVENLSKEVPGNAKDLQVTKMNSRLEVFITSGKPTDAVLKPTGVGLELAPITHPNDLVTGEAAKFALLMDAKPAANVEVTIIAGGIRYRDQLNEMKFTTDKEGKFAVTFKDPGMYWMNATIGGARRPQGSQQSSLSTPVPTTPGASRFVPQGAATPQRGPGGPGGRGGARSSYTATLEVLPQ